MTAIGPVLATASQYSHADDQELHLNLQAAKRGISESVQGWRGCPIPRVQIPNQPFLSFISALHYLQQYATSKLSITSRPAPLLLYFVRSPAEVKGAYLHTCACPSMASDGHEAFEVVPDQTPAGKERQQSTHTSSEYTNFNVSGNARLHAGNVYNDVHNHCP